MTIVLRGAHTEDGRIPSGKNSFSGGQNSNASVHAHSMAFGLNAAVTGVSSFALGGSSISGNNSQALGQECQALGNNSRAFGYQVSTTRSGQISRGAGFIAAIGDAQTAEMFYSFATFNQTPKIASYKGFTPVYINTSNAANVYNIAENAVAMLDINVVARVKDADVVAGWRIKGMITRPLGGVARILPGMTNDKTGDAGASTWAVAVTADTVNHALDITVTGQAATNVGWFVHLSAEELTR